MSSTILLCSGVLYTSGRFDTPLRISVVPKMLTSGRKMYRRHMLRYQLFGTKMFSPLTFCWTVDADRTTKFIQTHGWWNPTNINIEKRRTNEWIYFPKFDMFNVCIICCDEWTENHRKTHRIWMFGMGRLCVCVCEYVNTEWEWILTRFSDTPNVCK